MTYFRLLFNMLFAAVLIISACGTSEPEPEEVVRFTHATPPEGAIIQAGTALSLLEQPLYLYFVGVPKDLRIQQVVPPTFFQDVPFRIEPIRKDAVVRVLGPFSPVDSGLNLQVTWSTGSTSIHFLLVSF